MHLSKKSYLKSNSKLQLLTKKVMKLLFNYIGWKKIDYIIAIGNYNYNFKLQLRPSLMTVLCVYIYFKWNNSCPRWYNLSRDAVPLESWQLCAVTIHDGDKTIVGMPVKWYTFKIYIFVHYTFIGSSFYGSDSCVAEIQSKIKYIWYIYLLYTWYIKLLFLYYFNFEGYNVGQSD